MIKKLFTEKMKYNKFVLLLFLWVGLGAGSILISSSFIYAAEKNTRYQFFICNSAKVIIDSWGRYENARAMITVINKGQNTILHLDSIDFIGGKCQEDKNNEEKIIIQAYCGGTGCKTERFFVIDPDTLKIILSPQDGSKDKNNIQQVRDILGRGDIYPKDIITVGNSKE